MDAAVETQLLDQVRRGGPAARKAFQRLVTRHQAWLVRYLAYLLHDVSLADDIAQETFVKAYTSLATFRGDSALKSWLRRIATRLAFNHQRDAKVRSRYEALAGELRDRAVDPETATVETQALLMVMGGLPYPYREVLVMRFVEDLSMRQIGSTLDIGESAVKMRLKRARQAFSDAYAELDGHA